MNVLVIGGGGREHAIAWKLRQSKRLTDLHVAPGNAGTAAIAHNVDLPVPRTAADRPEIDTYLDAAVRTARDLRVDLVFVAPEDPLSWGLVDRLNAAGIPTFGPSRAAAEIESSKAWSRAFMARHDMPQPASATFDDIAAARDYVRASAKPVVIKADGLAAGKGVIVTASADEAVAALEDLMTRRVLGDAGNRVVVQERISGREVSAHAFTDGKTVASMPLSCDHKAIFDGGRGPNTGGMGVYSPPWWADAAIADEIRRRITEPAVAAMAAEGRRFRGVIYPGVIVNEAGPCVFEFNARMGDPETEALLPRLETDFLEIVLAVVNGRLHELPITWDNNASVAVAIASGGYPGPYRTGLPIAGLDAIQADVQVFHAGTNLAEDGSVLTAGGRVLNVVATAPTLAEARMKAYRNVERIHFEGMHYRRDIGLEE